MENDRFKTNVAVMIAFVTVLGAVAACLASVAVSNASDEDFAGLDAAIRAQKAEIIKPDGKYDLTQELQEARAEDAQNEDLDSEPYFTESDRLRSSSSFLAADMIVIAFSFWFLTVAQVTDKKIKYLWLALGILTMLAGIFGIIYGRFII